jgi:hypothetical protein
MKGKYTDEELAQLVTEYMSKYPNVTRNKIKAALEVGHLTLKRIEDKGLVKLPKKIKPGMNSSSWRSFK